MYAVAHPLEQENDMQRIEELAEELKNGQISLQITLTNGASGNGQNLYQGTILELYPSAEDVFTVKYTIERFGSGSLDDLEKVKWQKSNGLATWSILRADYEQSDDGVISFNQPTLRGSTARFVPLAEDARIAA